MNTVSHPAKGRPPSGAESPAAPLQPLLDELFRLRDENEEKDRKIRTLENYIMELERMG